MSDQLVVPAAVNSSSVELLKPDPSQNLLMFGPEVALMLNCTLPIPLPLSTAVPQILLVPQAPPEAPASQPAFE